jgi:hypothetical protein
LAPWPTSPHPNVDVGPTTFYELQEPGLMYPRETAPQDSQWFFDVTKCGYQTHPILEPDMEIMTVGKGKGNALWSHEQAMEWSTNWITMLSRRSIWIRFSISSKRQFTLTVNVDYDSRLLMIHKMFYTV